MIPTPILMFATIFVPIMYALLNKGFNFEFEDIIPVNKIFGVLALIIDFEYLHWVETPIRLNALFYSPPRPVNCPALLAICGILCLAAKPGSVMLDSVVVLFTLFFGISGIVFLGAFVDIVLVISALFLIVRSVFFTTHKEVFDEK